MNRLITRAAYLLIASSSLALSASNTVRASAEAYVTAGSNEQFDRGKDSELGLTVATAEASDPLNIDTNGKGEAEFLSPSGSTLRVRALATATALTTQGVTEDVAHVFTSWSDDVFPMLPAGYDSVSNPAWLKVETRLTGTLSGRAQIDFGVSIPHLFGNSISITPDGIDNSGFEAQFGPPEGPILVLLTSRIPVTGIGSSGLLMLFLEADARATKDVQSSLADFSENSLDIVALSIVDEFDSLIPGANITSGLGIPYFVRNSVPEPNSMALVIAFASAIAAVRHRFR